jgi:putative oxidoreductase
MSFVLDVTVQDQQFHLMKNFAIMGGLAYVLAYGAGPLSLDARRSPDS